MVTAVRALATATTGGTLNKIAQSLNRAMMQSSATGKGTHFFVLHTFIYFILLCSIIYADVCLLTDCMQSLQFR